MKRLTASAIGLALAAAATAVNLAENGSFEVPYFGSGFIQRNPGDMMGAWIVTGWIDHVAYDWWLPAEGDQSIDLNGPSAGSMYQDIPVEPGDLYLLKFAVSGNPYGYGDKTMNVLWSGSVLDQLMFPAGNTPKDMGWTYKSYVVQLGPQMGRLAFESTTGFMNGSQGYAQYYGPLVDDVSVQLMTQQPPEGIILGPGIALGGGVADLAWSDNMRLILRPGLVFNFGADPIQLRVSANLFSPKIEALAVRIESRASSGTIRQTVSAWDVVAGTWVRLDQGLMSTGDRVQTVLLEKPHRFVDDANGNQVVLEVTYRATNVLFTYPWTVSLDQVIWASVP